MYLSLSTHSVFAKWFKGGNCKSCLCLFPRALGALKWYLFLDQGRLLQLISSNPSPESIKSREPMYRLHCYCPCSLFSSERERASNLSPQPPLSFPVFFPFTLTPLSSLQHFYCNNALRLAYFVVLFAKKVTDVERGQDGEWGLATVPHFATTRVVRSKTEDWTINL